MVRAARTAGVVGTIVWIALLPGAALAADPGPAPGIPAAPQTSELAQQRAEREARDRATGSGGAGSDPSRTTAWERAVEQADGPHLDEIAAPRTVAAVIGVVWFVLAARAQWRGRRREAA